MMKQLAVVTPGLPAVVAKSIRFRMRDVFDGDGEYEARVIDRALIIGDHDEPTLRAALDVVEKSLLPGGRAVAVRALTKLRARTAYRASQGQDPHAVGSAYAEMLQDYPADVIDQACANWAIGSKWWPTWFDLKRECDLLCMRRLAEAKALTEALTDLGKPRPVVIEHRQETPEERLTALIAICRKHGREEAAAKAEISLAKLQARDPEPWALAVKPKAKPSPAAAWAGNDKLLELAAAARAKLMAGDQL